MVWRLTISFVGAYHRHNECVGQDQTQNVWHRAKRTGVSATTHGVHAFTDPGPPSSNACNGKAFDLYWLGRRNIEEAMNGPGRPAIERIMATYEEAQRIANGDRWEHGYWAGTLTFARLILGVAQTEDRIDEDEDAERTPVAVLRARALAQYPMLDS